MKPKLKRFIEDSRRYPNGIKNNPVNLEYEKECEICEGYFCTGHHYDDQCKHVLELNSKGVYCCVKCGMSNFDIRRRDY